MHGKGIFLHNDGTLEQGYWSAEKLAGYGRMILLNGSVYMGTFASKPMGLGRSVPHGKGTL